MDGARILEGGLRSVIGGRDKRGEHAHRGIQNARYGKSCKYCAPDQASERGRAAAFGSSVAAKRATAKPVKNITLVGSLWKIHATEVLYEESFL